MKSCVLIGQGDALEQAHQTAKESGRKCIKLELPSADRHTFDLTTLFTVYAADDVDVFVALDERTINYARHKLIAEVRLAGYCLINILSPRAIIDEGVRLMGNVYIGSGCNVAAGGTIGLGSWLARQVIVEQGVRLGARVTLQAGVQLGRGVEIGRGSTLGSGSIACVGTKVGRHCEWLLPGMLPQELPDRSFYDRLMPDGARILD